MIQFTRPWFLILALPLLWFTWKMAKMSLADLPKMRLRLALGLRYFIIIVLVLALAGARIVQDVSGKCIIFVMDVSDSISSSDKDRALNFINNAIKTASIDQKIGLVAFGTEASVELTPASASRVDKIYSMPGRSHTNINQALGLAMALFPENCSKKIVLISDGNETNGKAVEQAMLAGSNNVSIDTVPIKSGIVSEVLLEKMNVPQSAKIGEPFDLNIIAVSKTSAPATVSLLRNGALVGTKSIELPKGKSTFTFKQQIPKAGSYHYQAVLESSEDTINDNNVAAAYTSIKGKPKVLYVEGKSGQSSYLANALKANNIDVEVREKSGIPKSAAELSAFDVAILSDVSALQVSPEQMRMFQSGVKNTGMGFIMIGGEDSFGSGGYFDTPIEAALPVDMSVKKTRILPTLSVVIVMDKSGSMGMVEDGVEKIQLANNAAAAVVKLLQPIDKVGVIVCHSEPSVAVQLQNATNKNRIYGEISTIRAEGGGISVFPSMDAAYAMISKSGTRQKHIILLADGDDCDDQDGVYPLTQKMANEKITVTTVAIGDGKDINFLQTMSAIGKGGFYLALRARDLKAIFTKDVMTISKALLVEEPFVPIIDETSAELGGIDQQSLLPLLGYVVTSAKPSAKVMMISHKKDPILASWQYGLGKSIAFTSDCKSKWSARWLESKVYSKFWSQTVRSAMRKSPPSDYQSLVNVEGGIGRISVDAADEKGNFINGLSFVGSVVGPDMRAKEVRIEQTGPGRYETSFDADMPGTYLVNVAKKGKKDSGADVSVVNIPYSSEYKSIVADTRLLQQISTEAKGKYSPDAKKVMNSGFLKSKSSTDIWQFLTLLAIILFPIDVAVRRVAFSTELVSEVFAHVLKRVKANLNIGRSRKAHVERSETMETLIKKRSTKQTKIEEERPDINVIIEELKTSEKAAAKPEIKKETPKPDEDTTSRLLDAKRRKRDGS